jgi:hypothetical protein
MEMKVYYFTVMAVGIMLLFSLAGIDTASSKIVSTIGNPENWTSGFLWVAAIAAFGLFLVLTSRISALGFTFQASTESIVAAVVIATYSIFAADILSIISLLNSITGSTGTETTSKWIYYLGWLIIIPLMAGYTLALIDWIRGTD